MMQIKLFHRFLFKQLIFIIYILIFFIYCFTSYVMGAQQKLYEDLFSVTFPNEKVGWTCGRWGCILHTTDGGKTWVRQKSGTDYTLSSIFFVDPKKGWAVGDGGTILHTTDGGKNWVRQKSPVPYFLMKVYFVTPLKGWIVTEQTHILSTDDGGNTWYIQFKDVDLILKSISFCDLFHGWAVGEYGFIYHTRNGGKSWEKQAGKVKISEVTGDIEGGNFLFDVMAISPKIAWAIGIEGYVIKTVDGGKTWREVLTGLRKTQLFCIASNKKGSIVIGGNRTFSSSSDNGQTWKSPEFKPPIQYDWIYGISRRGNSGFVAVGAGGAIYLNTSTFWQRVVY